MEKLCPKQLSATSADPPNATFQLESIRPGLEEFNEDAAQAIRSLASPDFREDFERLVRAIEIEQGRPDEAGQLELVDGYPG